jgi:hypothetical protein
MALLQTQITSFNWTTGLKIDLRDVEPIVLDPFDTPLYSRFNRKPGAVNAVKHEWQEEPGIPNDDTANGSFTNAATTITVTDGTKFKARDVIRNMTQSAGEIMLITSIATNVLTVTRGYAGTTGTASSGTADVLRKIAYGVADGADPQVFSTTNRNKLSNYMQAFQEKVSVSTIGQWQASYGSKDPYGHEVTKVMRTMFVRVENGLIFGKPNEDTTNNTRTLGGLFHYITTNSVTGAGALTLTNLNDAVRKCVLAGGTPNLLVVSPLQKQRVSALITAAQVIAQVGKSSDVNQVAEGVRTDFGRLEIVVDRWMPDDRILVLDEGPGFAGDPEKKISVVTGIPFELEALAKTGAADNGQIYGMLTFELKAEKHHAVITSLT